jgi:hypothetical protein
MGFRQSLGFVGIEPQGPPSFCAAGARETHSTFI